jgi:DNA ligase D-like protein (predicted ligase)
MGTSLKGILSEYLKKVKKIEQPSFVEPMLATLTKEYFSSKDWIYETKFDGERCIAIKKRGKVSLMSRNHRSINDEYPELVEALLAQKADNFIIDGEIIALNKQRISDFELLQSRINLKALADIKAKVKTIPIYYCIFDLMYVDGYDIRSLPLSVRKQILKKLLTFNKMLTYTTHKIGNGITLFKQACKRHLEGLIVKKIDSTYLDKRSRLWLKFKCGIGQELVIGGYTEPQRSRTDFGALLVGYYKRGKLQFAGKVGTGFNQTTLTMLGKKLRALEVKSCPFVDYNGPETRTIHWVKPVLVAEFEFAQWTNKGRLRVPRYKGLRADKRAQDVVQEIAR